MLPIVNTRGAEIRCDPTDSKALCMDIQQVNISENITKASENILLSSEISKSCDHDGSPDFTRSSSPESSMFRMLPCHSLQYKIPHPNCSLNLGDSNENSFDLTEKILETLKLSSSSRDETKIKDCAEQLEVALKSMCEIPSWEQLEDHCSSHNSKVPIPIPFMEDDKDKSLNNNCQLLSQNDTKLSYAPIGSSDDNILSRLSSKSIVANDKFSLEIMNNKNSVSLHLNSMNVLAGKYEIPVTMSVLLTKQDVYASSSTSGDGLVCSSQKFHDKDFLTNDKFLAEKNHVNYFPNDPISAKINACNKDLEHTDKVLEERILITDSKISNGSSLILNDHADVTQDPNNTSAPKESGDLYVQNLVTKVKYVSLKKGTIYGNPKVYDSLGYKYTLDRICERNMCLVWVCCSRFKNIKKKCRVTLQQSDSNFEQKGKHCHTETLYQYEEALRIKSIEKSPRIFPLSIHKKSNRRVIPCISSQCKQLKCEEISSMEPLNLPVEELYISNDIFASKSKEKSVSSMQHSNSVCNQSRKGTEYSSAELFHSVVTKILRPRSITHVNGMKEHIKELQVNLSISADTIPTRSQTRKFKAVNPAYKYLFIQNNISKIKYISLREGIVAPFKAPQVIDSLGFIYVTNLHQCSHKQMAKLPCVTWCCINSEKDNCPAMLKQATHNFDQKGLHNHSGNFDKYYSKALEKKIVENSPVIFSRSCILNNFGRKSWESPSKPKMRMSSKNLNVSKVKTLNEKNSDLIKNKGTRKLERQKPSFSKSSAARKKSVGSVHWKLFPHYAVLKNQVGDVKLVDPVQGFEYKLVKTTEKFKTWICSRTNTHCCKATIKQCGKHFFKMRHKHTHNVKKREYSSLNNYKKSTKFTEGLQLQSQNSPAKKKSLKVNFILAKIKGDKNFHANKAIVEEPHEVNQEDKIFNSLTVNSAVSPKDNILGKRNVKIEKSPEINVSSRITNNLNVQSNKNSCIQYAENIGKANETQSLQNRKRLRQSNSYYSLKDNEDQSLRNGKRIRQPKSYCTLKATEAPSLQNRKRLRQPISSYSEKSNGVKEKFVSNSKVLSAHSPSTIANKADSNTKKVNYVENKCDDISIKCKNLILPKITSQSGENALAYTSVVSEFSRKSTCWPIVCEKEFDVSFCQEKLLEKIIKDILNVGYPLRASGILSAEFFKLLKEGGQYYQDREMTINTCHLSSAVRVEEYLSKNSSISQQYKDLVIMSYSTYSWAKLYWFYRSFEKSLKQNYMLVPDDYLDIKNSPRVFFCDLIKIVFNENCKESDLKIVFNVLCCVNSFGQSTNPLIIDNNNAIRKTSEMEEVKNYIMVGSKNGKLNQQIFHDWLLKFDSALVKREVPRPVILFLNGKNACISYKSIKHAENRNIVLYFVPPNSSHVLNPLFISVFPKLKENFITKVANKNVKAKKFPYFFMKAYQDINLFELARKGFQEARLCPYSGNVFDHSILKNEDSSKAGCGKIELVLPHDSRTNNNDHFLYNATVSDARNANMSPNQHVSCKNMDIEAKDETKVLEKFYLPSAKTMTSTKNLLLDKHSVILKEEFLESEEIYPS